MEALYTVYKHTSPSGKVYVGITSRDVQMRWRNNGVGYLNRQKNGDFAHPYFANAILKYGWDNISHEIIQEGLSKEEACKLEIEYIAKYKEQGLSYNITDGGEGHKSTLSPEAIEKLRTSHIGIKQSQETIQRRISKIIGKTRTAEQNMKTSKPVEQYNKNGALVNCYYGAREAERQTGINSSHIVDCCNCKPNRKTAGGYIWKWKE